MAGLFNLTKKMLTNKVVDIEIGKIMYNPNQPRQIFKQSEINNLIDSISRSGVLHPISVRKSGEKYEVIEGERRLKAAKMCEMQTIPCVVYEINDRDTAILALVEKIQRQNLTFFEESIEIEKLISDFGLTQEEAAAKLGKAQSTIANKLRLLRLSETERQLISDNSLTERHARALLKLGSMEDRMIVLENVIENKLNVEKTEDLIENYIGKSKKSFGQHHKPRVIQNISLFLNNINKSIDAMQTAGINAETHKILSDEFVELRVRIPVENV